MAIRSLAQVYCSLNLGLPYSINYDFSPQNGVAITVFFVNQQAVYTRPQYLQRAQIRIGDASFSMFAVSSDIQLSQGRRVMSVDFVDETYLLDNYQIVLTGKGCGFNIFQLGTPVDNRTPAQKKAAALDSDAQQIMDLTQFPDIEYSFNSFLTVLRQKFNVQVNAFYDIALTAPFMGTFREVLDQWCGLFNLSWFVENSVIKIFDPTRLSITLPNQPVDAIAYSSIEDVRSTYGKTCYNWFQQEGGQFSLNQTSNGNGTLLTRTNTLFPVGYEFNLPQLSPDLNQVAAAQFGQEFWFLYNYYRGTTSNECGWTPQVIANGNSLGISVANLGLGVAKTDPTIFNQKFQAYQQYGESTAGRWYLSNEQSELAVAQTYQWFDETAGQIFTFTHIDDKAINLQFLTPTNQGINVIPGTSVNQFYSGINYVGNRIIYQDNAINATSFALTVPQQSLVGDYFSALYEVPGSAAMPFAATLGAGTYAGYQNVSPSNLPSTLTDIFNNISAYTTGFQPRFTSVAIKGITHQDYSTLKSSQSEQQGVSIVNGSAGGTVVSNTAVIKTLKQGAYTVYYDKYAQCRSAFSDGPYFQHRFEPRQISSDNQIGITFTKQSSNIYRLNRDYSTINSLVNNPFLSQMAQARSFPTRKVTFTLNYFYNVPTNFLTNGLVGLSLSIDDVGVNATYSYSNEVLAVRTFDNQFARFEQQVRNSWIRQYQPNQVIS